MKKRNIIISAILILIIFSPFGYIIYAYNQSYLIFSDSGSFRQPLPSRIYDRHGTLISELFDEYRTYAPGDEIPQKIKRVFLAAEDSDFYKHTGFDLIGIFRAIVIDITSGQFRQGGSTITQQLVKQVYTNRERSIKRKLIELFITKEFENRYSKDMILEMYLNQIYFGHGVYGVKGAAAFYFSKELKDLDLAETAVLAALPSAPGKFSPLNNPGLSHDRSRGIIFNMIAEGYISREEGAKIFNSFWSHYVEELKVRFPSTGIRKNRKDLAPWFTEYIRRILIGKFGEDTVYRGGLVINTSLDLNYQNSARTIVEKSLKKQNITADRTNRYRIYDIERKLAEKSASPGRKNLKTIIQLNRKLLSDAAPAISIVSLLTGCDSANTAATSHLNAYENLIKKTRAEGALIALEPRTGEILAMIGGSTFRASNQLNRAVQSRRQPGSAFKAFVYGAAVEAKDITAATAFYDSPVTYKSRKDSWSPSNYAKGYSGKVLSRRALAKSLNIVPARIYDITGGKKIAQFASKLTGVPLGRFEIDPTLSLGTTEFSPLEMARGFAVYANRGVSVPVNSIQKIRDRDGKVIFSADKNIKKKRVTSEATAYVMNSMLMEVVRSGTASYAVRREAGFRYPCAGKTGTNTNFSDAWFIGYTPDISAAVWVGCDSPEFSLGHGQGGAVSAAPIWGAFMKKVYEGKKAKQFPARPEGVVRANICTVTGELAVRGCPSRDEYFIKGTVPTKKCDGLHGKLTNIKELIQKQRKKIRSRKKTGLFSAPEKEKKDTEEETFFFN